MVTVLVVVVVLVLVVVGGCGGVEAISDEVERSSKKLDNSVPSLQLANERLHRKRKS